MHDPIARKTSAYIQTISLSSMGIEMAMCVVIGLLLGRWIDGKLGTSPAFMIVFLLAGCAAAGRAVWRGVKKLDRLEKASSDSPDSTTRKS